MNTTMKKVTLGALVAGAMMSVKAPAQAQDMRTGSGYVRVLYAIPRGPKVDVYVDSRRIYDDVKYSGDPTKYTKLPAGMHSFRLVLNSPRRTLFSGTRRLRRDRFYTFAIIGTTFQPIVRLLDDTSGTTNPRRARLSVSHLSYGTLPVDIVARNKNLGSWLTITRGLRYGQTRQFLVPIGPYEIYVRAHGNVLLKISGVDLMAGRRYASYVLGKVGSHDGDNRLRFFLDVAASQ